MRLRGGLGCALAVVLGSFGTSWGQDSDRPRVYLHLRGQDTNPLTGVHDAWGVAAGVNFNESLGVELASDIFERRIRIPGFASIGEHGIASLVPQVRLRYPLFDRRLTPYVVGGVGVAFSEFNDRKSGALGRRVELRESTLVGTLGAGVEYFLADNIALGVEVKYLFAEDHTTRIDGVPHKRHIDSLLTTLGLRLFHPELRPAPPAESHDPVPTRLYLALRAGGALPTDTVVGSGLVIRPEPPAYGKTLNRYFGASLGLNVGRYLGAELVFEGYEAVLALRGLGSISEYAVYAVMPQIRLRYPLLDGLLVPYGLAGVGMAMAEVNDTKPHGAGITVRPTVSHGLAAAAGAGVEYFVASNIAFGLEAKYLHTSGLELGLSGGPTHAPNLKTVIFAVSLRVFLKDF